MAKKNKYTSPTFVAGNHVELVKSGEPFFTAVDRIIHGAKRYIHFQTYIFNNDETGIKVINSLKEAVHRGVKVYLILDAFGSHSLPKSFLEDVKNAGIYVRKFSPLLTLKGFQLSRRLHHKIVLVDGNIALIGGINVANRYSGYKENAPWLDYAVILQGPACKDALEICKKIWNRKFLKPKSLERIHNPFYADDGMLATVLQNNWFRKRIEISHSYREAFRKARKNITIMGSYFLPGRIERRLLSRAGLRGVDVRIILSKETDHPMLKRATNFLYGFFLRSKIKIYEFNGTVIHAKVSSVDNHWATVGSYNLNHLSDYGSVELNVSVMDNRFANLLHDELLTIIEKDCDLVTFESYKQRNNLFSKFYDWLSYQLIRFAMIMMYVLTRNQ
jgi:cardiolipin synthase A/B